MSRPEYYSYDAKALQIARVVLGIVGAILFTVAGAKMTGIHSQASLFDHTTSTAEVFYQGMGIVSYGLAVVCLLVGLPHRLAAPDTTDDDDVRPARTAAEPAVGKPTCPECGDPVEPQNLAGHLSVAHGLTDDEARALAGPVG